MKKVKKKGMKKMKKTGKILLSLMAVFGLTFMTDIAKAEEKIDYEYIDVDSLCIKKEEEKLVVQFSLKKDIDLTSYSNNMDVEVYEKQDDDVVYYGYNYNNGIQDEVTFIKVPNGTVCSVTNTDKGNIYIRQQPLKAGDTVAKYYTNAAYPEKFKNAENLEVEISVRDANYNYHNIIYSVKEAKIISNKSGHDDLTELVDQISKKYDYRLGIMSNVEDIEEYLDLELAYMIDMTEEEFGTKPIIIKDYKNKTFEAICAEIDQQIKSNYVTMGFAGDSSVDSTLLNAVKENGYELVAEYHDMDTEALLYSWIFDGSKMESSDFSVNLVVKVGDTENKDKINALIPNVKEQPLNLHFEHEGALPTGTRVRVDVSDTYADGDKLTLYYYNPTTNKLEEKVTNIKVTDGNAEFALEHCSDYVLAKEKVAPNNVQTSSINVVFYITLAIASLAGIGLLISKKKEIA